MPRLAPPSCIHSLGQMGDLPGWLSVVLGVFGLFGAGRSGVYRGGIRTHRLTDRRKVLDLIGPLPSIFMVPAPTAGPRELGDDLPGDLYDNVTWLLQIHRTVQLLPLKDRLLWGRIVQPIIEVDPTLFAEGLLPPQAVKAQPRRLDKRKQAYATWEKDIPRNPEHRERVSEFDRHLRRRVNPAGLSRIRDCGCSIRLYVGVRWTEYRLTNPESGGFEARIEAARKRQGKSGPDYKLEAIRMIQREEQRPKRKGPVWEAE